LGVDERRIIANLYTHDTLGVDERRIIANLYTHDTLGVDERRIIVLFIDLYDTFLQV